MVLPIWPRSDVTMDWMGQPFAFNFDQTFQWFKSISEPYDNARQRWSKLDWMADPKLPVWGLASWNGSTTATDKCGHSVLIPTAVNSPVGPPPDTTTSNHAMLVWLSHWSCTLSLITSALPVEPTALSSVLLLSCVLLTRQLTNAS